jgi:hypothetical protein
MNRSIVEAFFKVCVALIILFWCQFILTYIAV